MWFKQRDALLLVVALIVFVLDQLTKYVVTLYLGPGGQAEKVEIVGAWLRFEYVTNSGAAFGLFQERTLFFSVVAFVAIPVLLIFYRNLPSQQIIPRLCIGLLLGGTVGNLIDRIRFGYVVDFINAGIGHLRWPTFNVADSAFVIGVLVLALYLILAADKVEEKKKSTSER